MANYNTESENVNTRTEESDTEQPDRLHKLRRMAGKAIRQLAWRLLKNHLETPDLIDVWEIIQGLM